MARVVRGVCAVLVTAIWLIGCAPLISEYSLDAYKNATTLKAEVGAMVDKSGDAYASREDEVEALTTKIDAAYEFAAGLPDNALSTGQWQRMRDPEGGLYGGFVRLWREKTKTSPFYRKEKKKQLGAAFDYIICLEVNKRRARAC
jgi:hypothetical protein